jgi:hypothetical protein
MFLSLKSFVTIVIDDILCYMLVVMPCLMVVDMAANLTNVLFR